MLYEGNQALYTSVFLVSFLSVAAMIDWKKMIIPDSLLLVGSIVGILAGLFFSDRSFWEIILGVGLFGGLSVGLSLLTKGGLGMGDAKLFACLALFLSLVQMVSVVFWATCLSGLVGALLILIKKANRKTPMPFAPFILVGTVLTLFMS